MDPHARAVLLMEISIKAKPMEPGWIFPQDIKAMRGSLYVGRNDPAKLFV